MAPAGAECRPMPSAGASPPGTCHTMPAPRLHPCTPSRLGPLAPLCPLAPLRPPQLPGWQEPDAVPRPPRRLPLRPHRHGCAQLGHLLCLRASLVLMTLCPAWGCAWQRRSVRAGPRGSSVPGARRCSTRQLTGAATLFRLPQKNARSPAFESSLHPFSPPTFCPAPTFFCCRRFQPFCRGPSNPWPALLQNSFPGGNPVGCLTRTRPPRRRSMLARRPAAVPKHLMRCADSPLVCNDRSLCICSSSVVADAVPYMCCAPFLAL